MGGTPQVLEVGSRKARTLLAVLGVRHGHVAVDGIVAALWAEDPPRRPEANVATLVSRLRTRFGPDMILGGRSGYRLGETVRVDLSEAAGLVAEAETWLRGGQPGVAVLAAEEGVAVLGGGLVLTEHPTAQWAERARVLQAGLLRRGWHAATEGALGIGDPARAQVLAEAAIAADPLDEAAYRALMRACVAAGEPARALLAYQRLRATLAADLGADPAPSTRDLHAAILRDNATATITA